MRLFMFFWKRMLKFETNAEIRECTEQVREKKTPANTTHECTKKNHSKTIAKSGGFCYGFAMVLLWFCYGFAMVLLWFCYGCDVVVMWFCYGFAFTCVNSNKMNL